MAGGNYILCDFCEKKCLYNGEDVRTSCLVFCDHDCMGGYASRRTIRQAEADAGKLACARAFHSDPMKDYEHAADDDAPYLDSHAVVIRCGRCHGVCYGSDWRCINSVKATLKAPIPGIKG